MKHILFISLLFLINAGCSFVHLEKDLKAQKAYGEIRGTWSTEKSNISPMVVALVENNSQPPRLVDYVTQMNADEFWFLVPQGSYRIFVYEDSNEDGSYQLTERIGQSSLLELKEAGQKITVSVSVPETTDTSKLDDMAKIKAKTQQDFTKSRVSLGSTISLDDPVFNETNVAMGLWQPLKSIKSLKFGLFLLEPYDPARQPVLFVHGVSGSPRQFRSLIAALEKNKYQPWVVYYPSGFSISLTGDYLKTIIDEMHSRYKFDNLAVIAHSMGGLVTRSMLTSYGSSTKGFSVKTYITISTPWGGHSAAEMGLKYAPAVIPVWHDMVPGSPFLKDVFAKTLPPETDHYLLFSYQGSSSFAGGNSDGVVSIASQLYPEAQAGAAVVRGFDETHTSILNNAAMSEQIRAILARE